MGDLKCNEISVSDLHEAVVSCQNLSNDVSDAVLRHLTIIKSDVVTFEEILQWSFLELEERLRFIFVALPKYLPKSALQRYFLKSFEHILFAYPGRSIMWEQALEIANVLAATNGEKGADVAMQLAEFFGKMPVNTKLIPLPNMSLLIGIMALRLLEPAMWTDDTSILCTMTINWFHSCLSIGTKLNRRPTKRGKKKEELGFHKEILETILAGVESEEKELEEFKEEPV